MTTGILLNETYGEYKELETPLLFQCTVNGKHLTASIIGWVNHPINYIYRVEFSDGYVSDYYCNDYGKWFDSANEKEIKGATERLKNKAPYEFAIQNDLKDVHSFTHNERTHIFKTAVDGQDTNVYVHYSNSAEFGPQYSVYYNGDYQFTLEKKGKNEWHAFDQRVRDKRKIDPNLSRNICLLIESKEG